MCVICLTIERARLRLGLPVAGDGQAQARQCGGGAQPPRAEAGEAGQREARPRNAGRRDEPQLVD